MADDETPIHPELRATAKKFPRLPLNRWTVTVMRLLMGVMPLPKPAADVRISNRHAPTENGSHTVGLRVYQPGRAAAPTGALLWLHGGGLVIGTPRMNDPQMAAFARQLGIVVVSVDYRLAPAHPYPAAIDDCYTALKWTRDHAGELGIDPGRIAVGGASAGGGLAAALAQMAHDRAEGAVACQLLVYPMLDDRSCLAEVEHPELLTWTTDNNRFGWEAYLCRPAGLEETRPYAVPGRREDLSGLPPAWIGVGSLDLFRQEDVDYAARLRACGVACELVVVEGAFHGFDAFMDDAPVIEGFFQSQVEALRRYVVGE